MLITMKLILFLLYVTLAYGDDSNNSNDNIHFAPIKYYVGSKEKQNWYLAMQDCKVKNMDLVKISSFNDQIFVEKVMAVNNLTSLWTSGTNQGGAADNFYWMTTGEDFDYNNWFFSKGQMTFISNECVNVVYINSEYKWTSANCGTEFNYICIVRETRILQGV